MFDDGEFLLCWWVTYIFAITFCFHSVKHYHNECICNHCNYEYLYDAHTTNCPLAAVMKETGHKGGIRGKSSYIATTMTFKIYTSLEMMMSWSESKRSQALKKSGLYVALSKYQATYDWS